MSDPAVLLARAREALHAYVAARALLDTLPAETLAPLREAMERLGEAAWSAEGELLATRRPES